MFVSSLCSLSSPLHKPNLWERHPFLGLLFTFLLFLPPPQTGFHLFPWLVHNNLPISLPFWEISPPLLLSPHFSPPFLPVFSTIWPYNGGVSQGRFRINFFFLLNILCLRDPMALTAMHMVRAQNFPSSQASPHRQNHCVQLIIWHSLFQILEHLTFYMPK